MDIKIRPSDFASVSLSLILDYFFTQYGIAKNRNWIGQLVHSGCSLLSRINHMGGR